jgi:hypothetical protein
MKRINAGWLWAGFFVLIGILLLLWNFGVLGPLGTAIWGGLYIAAGLVFLAWFFTDRTRRWEAVAGTTLIGTGAITLLQWQQIALGDWKLALVLLSVALGFWLVAIFRPADWWAILPAGVLTLEGLLMGLARQLSPQAFDALFLAGLGAVFAMVFLLRLRKGDARWALVPAVALALTGLVSWFNVTENSADLLRLWPAALIVLGIVIGFLTLSRRSKPAPAAAKPATAPDASVMAPGAARVEDLPEAAAPGNVDIYDVIKNQPAEK